MRTIALLAMPLVLSYVSGLRAEPNQPTEPEPAYAAAIAALEKGADDEAVDRLELLADQGFVHPDASLARAAAYLSRAQGTSVRPGDLGRAAAALTETLLLRPNDTQAERALDAVQAEIAKRRASSRTSVVVRPSLSRAVASLLSEQVWAGAAAVSSLVLALGITARRLSTRALSRLSGGVAIAVGGVALVAFCLGAYASYRFRVSSQPAVVVVSEARLLDETGRPLPAKRDAENASAPEGAMVYVLEQIDGRCRVEWGGNQGFLGRSELQLLARP